MREAAQSQAAVLPPVVGDTPGETRILWQDCEPGWYLVDALPTGQAWQARLTWGRGRATTTATVDASMGATLLVWARTISVVGVNQSAFEQVARVRVQHIEGALPSLPPAELSEVVTWPVLPDLDLTVAAPSWASAVAVDLGPGPLPGEGGTTPYFDIARDVGGGLILPFARHQIPLVAPVPLGWGTHVVLPTGVLPVAQGASIRWEITVR